MTGTKDSTGKRKAIAASSAEMQLDLPMIYMPSDVRALPWAALRSALFAPVMPGARKAMTRAKIAAVGDYQITYTGHQLDQADLDTWEAIVHMARKDLGKPVAFKNKPMLEDMGKGSGKSQREWLLNSLSRLTACEVEIKHGDVAYAGSLIQEHGRDDKTGMHYVVVNKRIASLYWASENNGGSYSVMRREERSKLAKKQLAKWLHGFMANSNKPLAFAIAKLQELSGSRYSQERDFRAAINEAAADVSEVVKGKTLIVKWDLRRRNVTLAMVPQALQGA